MGYARNLSSAVVLAMSLQAHAQPVPVQPVDAPPQPLIANCETKGHWTSVPQEDVSSMARLGRFICTEQPFEETLGEPNATRARTFNQLGLAYDYLNQRLALGRAVESGTLKAGRLPNVWVTRIPYASDNGNVVYSFEITVRRNASESGKSLVDEVAANDRRVGKITGLFEVRPATQARAAL